VILSRIDSDFLRYLLGNGCQPGARLPALEDVSAEIGVSVGKLREQLEVARALGLVEVSPRRGIHCRGYEFLPAIRMSLLLALSLDRGAFAAFSALRTHLETAFWDEAVVLLTPADKAHLGDLVAMAWHKLGQERIQIPHPEHRELHLTIFSRLPNPFVRGLLEAYWDGYEAVEFSTYADYGYLRDVWTYHERIVEALCAGDFPAGKQFLTEHMRLIDKLGVAHEGKIAVATKHEEESNDHRDARSAVRGGAASDADQRLLDQHRYR
jgi:DNA-binding FadR family transcriptional regulator